VSTIISQDLDQILSADLPWTRLAGKTVIVTGAGGFLPSWFVFTLMRLNDLGRQPPCRLVAVVRDRQGALERLAPFVGRNDFQLITADLSEAFLPPLPVNYIIHAASPASPRQYMADPVGTLSVNTEGTTHLLRLAHANPSSCLMFFSSGEVYGQTPDGLIDEDAYGYLDPTDPRSCYGEAKRAGEALCVAWSRQYGVDTRIVRPMHTYGPGIGLGDGRVFSDFTDDIISGRDILLKSDGLVRRPFCYVADAMLGYFTVLFKGETARPYSVGNDLAVLSIRELAELLVDRAFPERNLKVRYTDPNGASGNSASQIKGSTPDLTRLRALGWVPRTDPITGFQRTVRSFEEQTYGRV
jgi:nucleoside-diphosphate-sugar epimerase